MKKIFLLIFGISLMSLGGDHHSQNMAALGDNFSPHFLARPNPGDELTVEDVKFEYDKKVFSDVKSSVIEATPLENKDDKPDYVQSRRVNFQIHYKIRNERPAEISVYAIDQYKKAFAVAPDYIETIEKNLADLRKVIAGSTAIRPSGSEELPFVPYADAAQAFYTKARTVRFQNGKGLLFLTQMTQDAMIVNNSRLDYIFQGLTDDGRYFILAAFPVAAKGLPENDTDSFEGYQIPDDFYGENSDKNEKAYLDYTNKTAVMLENLTGDKFAPDLKRIEELVSSIKIG